MSFWDVVWFIIISFFFIAYLMILFSIIGDIFRDREMGGGMKAVWLILLVFFPLITALVYVIARGAGMAQRHYDATVSDAKRVLAVTGESAGGAGGHPTDQIAKGKELLDSGAITQAEFDALKQKALS